jgi:hypothetical protein
MTTGRESRGSLYVYALLDSPRRPIRLPGPRIELVRFGAIAAAVERRRTPPAISERSLRTQHRIVRRLHEVAGATLPVRFGALVDYAELERVIGLRRGVLLRALRQVRGKEQMTVRVFGTAASTRSSPTPFIGSGADYLKARAAATRPVPSPIADAVRRAVRTIVSAERLDPGRGGLELSIHHLVGGGCVDDYRARVNRVVASAPPLAVSGPWPPFAFTPDLWE